MQQLHDASLAVQLHQETVDRLGEMLRAQTKPLVQGGLLLALGFFLVVLEAQGWGIAAFSLGVLRCWLGLR